MSRRTFPAPRPAARGRHAPSLTNQGPSSAEAPPLRALPPARSCHGGRARPCESPVAAAPLAPASVFATAFGQPACAVCLRQRAQPAACAHARPVVGQPFRRARPPRHALAAAPAPCALGHPRLRFPGCPRRRMASPGSRRGHTRRLRPAGHRLAPLAPTPARAIRAAADPPARPPGAAETVTVRQRPGRRAQPLGADSRLCPSAPRRPQTGRCCHHPWA